MNGPDRIDCEVFAFNHHVETTILSACSVMSSILPQLQCSLEHATSDVKHNLRRKGKRKGANLHEGPTRVLFSVLVQ